MKKGYTHISIVLDRSGSMASCKQPTIEGFNAFIQKQQETPGKATVTLVQFDDQYQVDYGFLPILNVPVLDSSNYQPRGGTALLDALGRSIKETGEQLAALDESDRPERVIFVVQTDGAENASRAFDYTKISDMIKHQQDVYKWDFVFLGANQDAIASAKQMGMNAKSSMTYCINNSKSVFETAAGYTTKFRTAHDAASASSVSFSEEDRTDAVQP